MKIMPVFKRYIGNIIFRRLTQLTSIVFVLYAATQGPWRNFKVAHNSRRLVGLMEGEWIGILYGINDDFLNLLGKSKEVSLQWVGSHAASSIFGLPVADPSLALGQTLSIWMQGGSFAGGLILGAVIPIAVALLLGKVFCSHLCPARFFFEFGQGVRAGILKLKIPLPHWSTRQKYGVYVFLGCILGSLLGGASIWLFFLPHAALGVATHLIMGVSMSSFLWVYLLLLWAFDAFLAPGFFCHTLCPTGFLLESAGRFSPLHLVNPSHRNTVWAVQNNLVTPNACPTNCHQCEVACPYSLSPKKDDVSAACDHCGKCVQACPQEKLQHVFERPLVLQKMKRSLPIIALFLVYFMSPAVHAHHNKGLPHYGYFENYPQVPTQEYVYIQNGLEIGATIFNFQGLEREYADTPNDVKIFLYIHDLKKDQSYEGPIDFELHHNGQIITKWHRDKVDDENIYSTRETLPESGTYVISAKIPNQTSPLLLSFEVDMGDRISIILLTALILPVFILFAIAFYGKKKKKKKKKRKTPIVAASLFFTIFFVFHLPVSASPKNAFNKAAIANEDFTQKKAVKLIKKTPKEGLYSLTKSVKEGEMACGSVEAMAAMKAAGQGCGSAAAMETMPRNKEGEMACIGAMKHVRTEDGGQVMIMSGMPLWLFVLGIVFVLVLSFVAVELFPAKNEVLEHGIAAANRRAQKWRINLLKNKRVYFLVKNRLFSTIPQIFTVFILFFLVYAGLYGSRVANITPVAVWTLWWAALIFFVALLGPIFCAICPWDALANLLTRLRFKSRNNTPLSLGMRFPTVLQNLYPAILMFTLLTWLELGNGITTSPKGTAYMAIGMTAFAIITALLFGEADEEDAAQLKEGCQGGCPSKTGKPNGKVFCRYLCPVGRISGIYANLSAIEIRAKKPGACKTCMTEDCLNGNEMGYPCPTGISLKVIQDSTYCTQCMECVRSCPRQNIAINIRPFALGLHQVATQKMNNIPENKTRLDEAWLAVSLLSLTLFHGLSMTPAWENFQPGGASLLKFLHTHLLGSKTMHFTLGMVLVCGAPMLLYGLSCRISAQLVKHGPAAKELFARYSWSLLPVALFYHLAHNLMHLIAEGSSIIPLLSDPLGRGVDYFGTAGKHYGALFSENTIWIMQVTLILVGHIIGIIVAHRIGHRLYENKKDATRSLIPMLFMMIILSVVGLSLMAMDMNMRIGRM